MIKILKIIVYSASNYLFFDSLTKSNFRMFLDNFNIHLRSLNILNLFEVLKNLTTNNLPESPSLRGFSIPFNIDLKLLSDTSPKILFLIGFVFL